VIEVVRNNANEEVAEKNEETTTYEAEPETAKAAEPQMPDAELNEAENAADKAEAANSDEPEPETDAAQSDEAPEAEEADGAETENPEIVRLTEQVQDLQNRLLRAQADFDNFRRRTRMEKEEFAKYASQNLIEQLLPVVDNFERAIAAAKDAQDAASLQKGVEMIYRQLLQILEQEGVQPIEAVGQPFNPEFHQAVMRVESEDQEEGIVVEELQKGYRFKGKVIRPSMVKVTG
jgi:molecular chaperone GrpE